MTPVDLRARSEAARRAGREVVTVNNDVRRRIREGTRQAMRQRAERLRCLACLRKSALMRLPNSGGVAVCRYCKHESTPDTRAEIRAALAKEKK